MAFAPVAGVAALALLAIPRCLSFSPRIPTRRKLASTGDSYMMHISCATGGADAPWLCALQTCMTDTTEPRRDDDDRRHDLPGVARSANGYAFHSHYIVL